jgi:hypothetical protein
MRRRTTDVPVLRGRSPRQRSGETVEHIQRAVVILDDSGDPGLAGWLLLALVEPELRRPGALDPQARSLARAAGHLLGRGAQLRAATELFLSAGEQHVAAELLWKEGQDSLANRISHQRGRTPLGDPIPGLSLLGDSPSAAHTPSFHDAVHRALRRVEDLARPDFSLKLYDGLGMRREAALRAQALGMGAAAAPRLLATGQPFEAARCWAKAGDTPQALEALYVVSKDSPSYRAACVLAIELADQLDELRFELDHLVGPFSTSEPQSSVEIGALRCLAGLYQRHGRLHAAREVIERLYASEPGLVELVDDLANITRVLGEQDAPPADPMLRQRRGRASPLAPSNSMLDDLELPSLPELPELPGMPSSSPDLPGPRGRRPVPQGATVARDRPRGEGPIGATLAPLSGFDKAAAAPKGSHPTMDFGDDPVPPAPAVDQRPVGPGVLVAGRYMIESLLGQGGMGAVFRAFDQELDEAVALKVLTGSSTSEAMLERFRQELRLARRLTHRNIVRVHDIGMHAGQRFISMEMLQGADLRNHMSAGHLPRGVGIDLLQQSAAGLQAAHDMGVVHRDVKPENLFVTLDSVVKVMDFGIARTVLTPGMTMDGAMGGTATYMAPEQASDFSSVDGRADQYALGVVAFELLCGRPPFEHEALMPLLHMHATEPPPHPMDIDPSIPEPLAEVVLRALSKDPGDRYPDCIDFGRELMDAWDTPYHGVRR